MVLEIDFVRISVSMNLVFQKPPLKVKLSETCSNCIFKNIQRTSI